MPIDILLTVVITSIIQSIFGVGVLLFGTPLLLLFGYSYINALIILLPISVAINSLQIAKHHNQIDSSFYKQVLIFTIPLVVFFLFLVTTTKININIIVGVFLIFVALKSFYTKIEALLEKMFTYEKSYLMAMGIVHGLTNLGGSLLTAAVHAKQYTKDITRVTVAACYATFAVFQIGTLFFSGKSFDVSLNQNMIFLTVGLLVFVITDETVYTNIDNQKYSKYFASFLFVSGVLLIIKAMG